MPAFDVAPATTEDYRRLSRRRLPRFLFDYIDGGANDELTMAANVADFARVQLRQRVLRDVSGIDTSTTLAGQSAAMPLALAPVGMAGMFSRRGEVIGVRAAERAGVPFTLSTVGVCPLAELRAASTQPFWFQLYMLRDRGVVKALLERAREHGVDVLAFTVDLPLPGMRQRDFRNGMNGNAGVLGKLRSALDLLCSPGWVLDVGLRGKPHTLGNLSEFIAGAASLQGYKDFIGSNFDPAVTWRDIEWLRGQWTGKLLLKGVLEVEDARAAVAAGADGVIVSNHGGRQLDSVRSSIAALPAIAQAVGADCEVLMDGGVRSGLDVLKAVALGARGVLIGRPWVWAASGGGQRGLEHLLGVFREELRIGMALTGAKRVADIDRELVLGDF
jgi:L-lactate dehydrogenase (cytochrome)